LSTDDNVGPMAPPAQIEPDQPSGDRGARAWPQGWQVRVVDEIPSTNTALIAEVDQARDGSGPADRTVLAARYQTAGRGRLDRRWEAPPGANLLVSILFTHPPSNPIELIRRVGLAAIDACHEIAGVSAVLKWPNDLLLDGAKLAGILAQTANSGAVVVGLGLNVGWAPPDAARLSDHVAGGASPDPLDVLEAVLVAYDRLPADVSERYRAALDTLGRRVRVEQPGGELIGRALDVDSEGALVVLDDCAITHRVDIGDVVHLRDHPDGA